MRNKNKFNLSKVIILLFTICTSFISCDDLREDILEAKLDPSVLVNSKALNSAVIGMYSKVVASTRTLNGEVNAYAGDDITTNATKTSKGKTDVRLIEKRMLNPFLSKIGDSWKRSYKVIQSANLVIANENITKVDPNIPNDQQNITALFGEAYFMRGLFYFKLTRDYGKVPLILSSKPDSKTGKSEIIDVYKQIEADFLKAETLLPNKYPNVPAAIRPNKGSVRAYLAKLYLHWAGWPLKDNSKYEKAASYSKLVIENAGQHGFGLVSDLNSLWSIKESNKYNSEIVYGIPHCFTCDGKGNRKTGRVAYPVARHGWNDIFAEVKYFEDFPEGPRKDATFKTSIKITRTDNFDIDGNPRANPLPKGTVIEWQDFDEEPHPLIRKLTGHADEITNPKDSNNDVTTYKMRYAELLLIYAEAEGRSGGSSALAWESLNKVRRRAYNGVPGYADITSGDLAELAYTERKWELGGEFKRWDDLARMERVELIKTNRSPRELVDIVSSQKEWGDVSMNSVFLPLSNEICNLASHLCTD